MGKFNKRIRKLNLVQGIILGVLGGSVLFLTAMASAAEIHPPSVPIAPVTDVDIDKILDKDGRLLPGVTDEEIDKFLDDLIKRTDAERKRPRYFNKKPFINPKIIEYLSTSLSDTGDQIVSINLYDSQDSNFFCCESDLNFTHHDIANPTVFFVEGEEEFGYRHIGKTETDIHILYTYYSGGGSGTFKNIMLVTLKEDYGAVFNDKQSTIKATRKRLLIKKLGEIGLGDRWSGSLKVDGNNLIIGKDKGWFAGTDGGCQRRRDNL